MCGTHLPCLCCLSTTKQNTDKVSWLLSVCFKSKRWLRHVTETFFVFSDGCGGFPEDDPGGREDGRRCAARKIVLLHDVEPPNQHTGHCTGISRYLKASCQFSSTSADSTPQGPKYPIRSIYGSESTVIYQYSLFPFVIPVFFVCLINNENEWWFPCPTSPTVHPSSISVLSTDAKHRASLLGVSEKMLPCAW